jgi:hypothetical protein
MSWPQCTDAMISRNGKSGLHPTCDYQLWRITSFGFFNFTSMSTVYILSDKNLISEGMSFLVGSFISILLYLLQSDGKAEAGSGYNGDG